MASRFYRENDDYYYDPAEEMTPAPAAVSGIGDSMATTAVQQATAQQAATSGRAGVGGLGSYQLSDPSLAATPDFLQDRDPSLNRINWGGNYDPVTGRLGVLPFFVGGSEAQDASYFEGGDTSDMMGYSGVLETGLPTYQLSTRFGRPIEDYITLNPAADNAIRLVNTTKGEVSYEGKGDPEGLVKALDQATADGNRNLWALQAKVGDQWVDTYRNEPIGNIVRDVALPMMLAMAGGAALGPLLLGGGAIGTGLGTAAGSFLGNIAAGRSLEDSLKAAAISGVTAGVLKGVMPGVTSGSDAATGIAGTKLNAAGQIVDSITGVPLSAADIAAAKIASVASQVGTTGASSGITNAAEILVQGPRIVSNLVPSAIAGGAANVVLPNFGSVDVPSDVRIMSAENPPGTYRDTDGNFRDNTTGEIVVSNTSTSGSGAAGLGNLITDTAGNLITVSNDATQTGGGSDTASTVGGGTNLITVSGDNTPPGDTAGLGNLITDAAGNLITVSNDTIPPGGGDDMASTVGGGTNLITVSGDNTPPGGNQRTVSSILGPSIADPLIRVTGNRERLALDPGLGQITYEDLLNLGPEEIQVKNQRIREGLTLPSGIGSMQINDILDLGVPSEKITVTGRRNPLTITGMPGQPVTLSEELFVPTEEIINVTGRKDSLGPAPVTTGPTTQRANLNVRDEDPITVTGSRIGLPAGLGPGGGSLINEALSDTGGTPAQKRTVLSTLKQISGLVPLVGALAEAVDGGDGGGGTIDRGTGYATPTYGRQRNLYNDDPFTYGQRSGELKFFGNRTLLDPGTVPTGTTTTAGGGTTPPPAENYVPTAADIQAAYPGFSDIRQDAQGRWFGTPIPGFTPSGQTATGRRVTAGGTFAPTVEDVTYFNPGFESITRNAAGEFVGSKTEELPGSPAMTEAQVRARYPGYTSYQKDANGQWTGTKAGPPPAPQTEAQVRAANPGYDAYEQDASGQWFGVRNPTTTAGRAATEEQVRAANPGYDAYEKDASGQWVGIRNVAGTTSGVLTEAQVRAANPGYDAFEQDASGEWYGIKNVETRTPGTATLDQVRAQYGANYDNITQNEAGRFIGTRTIAGQDTPMTLDQIRAANPQYNRIEQLPTGEYVGITDVEERTTVPFTLDDVLAQYGSQYDSITQDPEGRFVGTRTVTRAPTLEDVRGLGLGFDDYEQDEAGNFYGIRNTSTSSAVPYTLADAQQRFGSQYSNIYQNPQGQFVGVGTRQVPQQLTVEDARRMAPGYDAYEQGDDGFYGIRNTTTTVPGAAYTVADAERMFPGYQRYYVNDAGQFVGENTETDRNFAEGGEVYDDMVSHLISYRKGGGHMGPGRVSGIGSGQEDKIPAWLSDGEYVWSAQDVADLGDGSTDEGVRRLDRMRQMVRKGAGRKDVKKIAKPQRGIEDMLKAVGGAV